jgi:hypothetical protein
MIPQIKSFNIAMRARNIPLVRLLVKNGFNPFALHEDQDSENYAAASPFVVAARQEKKKAMTMF